MIDFKLLEHLGLETDLPASVSQEHCTWSLICPLCFSFEDSNGKHAVDFLYGSVDFLKALENDQFHAISRFPTSLTILEFNKFAHCAVLCSLHTIATFLPLVVVQLVFILLAGLSANSDRMLVMKTITYGLKIAAKLRF
ncbi:hypothetical protein H0E87_030058 [Populus deltoides]|uniref:Uncharacterized protein n=1 Tax=Populus deltoides TaxID=3696 RepID=A0A8T2WSW4_POPDE|nr:hypothetical protein H0E87_030058 [Populus deltoides]